MTEIMKWRELGDDFTDSLILGNGASIAVEPRMEYSSLLGEARASGLLTPSVEEVFRRFNTADFEYVLSLLWRATQVNDILGITEETTRNAYEKIRLALARSISKIHPSQSEVRHHLPPIYSFAKQFSTIVSLCCQSATMGQIGTREDYCYGEPALSFLTVRL